MNNQEVFAPILEEGEQLIAVLKPEKRRFVWARVISAGLLCLWWVGIAFLVTYVSTLMAGLPFTSYIAVPLIATGVLAILPFSVVLPLRLKEYHQTFYAYSANRVMTRKGVFSIKFKTASKNEIVNSEIGFTFSDKVFKTNTGTLIFTTRAGVYEENKNTGLGRVGFEAVERPFETLKGIHAEFNEKGHEGQPKEGE